MSLFLQYLPDKPDCQGKFRTLDTECRLPIHTSQSINEKPPMVVEGRRIQTSGVNLRRGLQEFHLGLLPSHHRLVQRWLPVHRTLG